jgi:hypothetical protein
VPEPVPVPYVTGLPLGMAGANFETFEFQPVDLRPLLQQERARMVIDWGNWTVLAQCPVGGLIEPGGTIRVGVMKSEEVWSNDGWVTGAIHGQWDQVVCE